MARHPRERDYRILITRMYSTNHGEQADKQVFERNVKIDELARFIPKRTLLLGEIDRAIREHTAKVIEEVKEIATEQRVVLGENEDLIHELEGLIER